VIDANPKQNSNAKNVKWYFATSAILRFMPVWDFQGMRGGKC